MITEAAAQRSGGKAHEGPQSGALIKSAADSESRALRARPLTE